MYAYGRKVIVRPLDQIGTVIERGYLQTKQLLREKNND